MQFNITQGVAILAGIVAIVGYFLNLVDGAVALQTIFASLAVFGIRKSISAQTPVAGASPYASPTVSWW